VAVEEEEAVAEVVDVAVAEVAVEVVAVE